MYRYKGNIRHPSPLFVSTYIYIYGFKYYLDHMAAPSYPVILHYSINGTSTQPKRKGTILLLLPQFLPCENVEQ